jgi:type IV pilus assembly protein PilA
MSVGFQCLKSALGRLQRESGVTLIELLVVLIIIGLLAAIGIAAFTGQQDKAHDADAKIGVRSAQTAMETYYVDHKSYTGATVSDLEEVQPSLRDAPNLTVNFATSDTYEVEATSVSSKAVSFSVRRHASGTVTRSCSPPNTGGCGSSSW